MRRNLPAATHLSRLQAKLTPAPSRSVGRAEFSAKRPLREVDDHQDAEDAAGADLRIDTHRRQQSGHASRRRPKISASRSKIRRWTTASPPGRTRRCMVRRHRRSRRRLRQALFGRHEAEARDRTHFCTIPGSFFSILIRATSIRRPACRMRRVSARSPATASIRRAPRQAARDCRLAGTGRSRASGTARRTCGRISKARCPEACFRRRQPRRRTATVRNAKTTKAARFHRNPA